MPRSRCEHWGIACSGRFSSVSRRRRYFICNVAADLFSFLATTLLVSTLNRWVGSDVTYQMLDFRGRVMSCAIGFAFLRENNTVDSHVFPFPKSPHCYES
jgi:hypothetical protein